MHMQITPATLSVSKPLAKTARERVLFAFGAKDRNQFFPSLSLENLPHSGHRFDTDSLKNYDHWEGFLKEFRPTILVSCWSTPRLPDPLLHTDALPLRYLCHTTGTVRNLVGREFLVEGGVVSNWGNVISQNVAEHALMLILTSLRSFTRWRETMKEGQEVWGNGQFVKTRSLQGKTVGLHGFGKIARELLALLAPFNVECIAFSPNVPPGVMRKKGVTPCADLKELFRKSDVVVECEALTEETLASVTEAHFRMMKEDAVFVNVGRGSVIDEDALLRVAKEGRIRVALDVFQTEPLPKDSPLWDVEHMILSPHLAGPAGDWFHRCGDHALSNVDRYLKGKPLVGEVTLELYDRST